MATITKQRLIYTSGTFKLDDEIRACRRILVYVDVLRKPPSAVYQNERSNPTKHFFGYVSLFVGDYVSKVLPLEYESQLVLEYDNLELQLFETINCSVGLLVDTIAALGSVMTPPAVLIPVTPTPPGFPGCRYDWIKFKLEPLTRIQVTAFAEQPYGCDDITFTIDVPDLPDETPPYPSDRDLAEDPPRSDPEDGENSGDSTPASAEDPDLGYVPTEGDTDVIYQIGWTWKQFPGGSLLTRNGVRIYAPFGGIRWSADHFSIEAYCKGYVGTGAPAPPNADVGWVTLETLPYNTGIELTLLYFLPWP